MSRIVSCFTIIFIAVFSLPCTAQTLYMPRDVKQAFKNNTRSMDGRPGKNYWQNHGRYTIAITAMPPDRNIKGTEQIEYFNNSPDTLMNPSIKLFLNIHKPGAPRDEGATEDYLTTGVHIDECRINGKVMSLSTSPFIFTNLPIHLSQPLLPHDSMAVSFNWHYEISLQSGREGMIDSTTYFLAYYYPRVAVFDDYNGWDRMPFVDSHEFYSDFNDYNVTITVPKNYVVWGTGTLQRPGDLLQPEILKRFNESMTSDQVINIVTRQDWLDKHVTTQNSTNSWQFISKNVPDAAFGLSDHFDWDGTSVVVDDGGRRASAQAAYNDTAADYHHVAGYARHSLDWLSHHWPGVPYPYEKTTVFQGYAGMEYPMMANDESYRDTSFSRFVADHEIAHTYMPFYMGINETRYGFMDEGWATTFELLIGRAEFGEKKADAFYKRFRVLQWVSDLSPGEDVPIVGPGDDYTGEALGDNEYGKPSLGYLAVKDLLGDDLFKKCLHEYINRWHGKHPIPWDFFFTFNDVAGKSLNWFWNSWFFSNGYIDMGIRSATKSANNYSVEIENIGGMPAPVDVIAKYADGSEETFHQTPAIWEKNLQHTTIRIPAAKKITSITLDGGIFMDADLSNNTWKEKTD